MRFYSKKIINLVDCDLHLHYANNKGRGTDNVTITVVPSGTPRPVYTRYYDKSVILEQWLTSGWAGTVYIPDKELTHRGGIKA
jgi:hypothetical protein